MIELEKPDFKNHIEIHDAVNKDIRDVLHKDLPVGVKQAAPLANAFKGASEIETARNIWDYLRNKITYKKDADGYQDIRLPRRFLHDKTGDCKSYSLTALSIYKAVYPNLAVAFKFTSYDPGASEPTHVYAVVKDGRNNNIIIDGCYNFFNQEKEYTFTLPLNWDMKVRTLSGLSANFHQWYDTLTPADRTAVKAAMLRKIEVEKMRAGLVPVESCQALCDHIESEISKKHKGKRKKKAGLFFKKLGHGVAFITLAPVRGALAALIALNLNGLASNLRLVEQAPDKTHWNKLVKFWHSVGGLDKAFKKAVELGTKHKALWMGKKAHQKFLARAAAQGLKPTDAKWLRGIESGGGEIGLLPAAIPPMIALGSGLLAAILPILKKALDGTGHHAQAASVEGTAEELIDAHNAGQLDPSRYAESDLLNADTPPDPDNEDPDPDEQGDTSESESDYDSIDGIGDDLFTEAAAAANKLAPPSAALDTFNALTPALDTLFQTGTSLAAGAIQASAAKHPKLKAILDNGERFADSYFTHKHLKKHGVHWPGTKGGGVSPIMLAAGAGLLYVVATSGGGSKAVNGIGRGLKKVFRFKRK